jgi:hypothetical protein
MASRQLVSGPPLLRHHRQCRTLAVQTLWEALLHVPSSAGVRLLPVQQAQYLATTQIQARI